MQLFDISLPLSSDLPSWPGDPRPEIQRISKIAEGEASNVTHLSMTAHTGTHIDAPDHFLDNGVGVDNIPLGLFIGPAEVVELHGGDVITRGMLEDADLPGNTKRLLFKTPNSANWARGERDFQTDFMGLSQDGAQYLLDRGVEVIGVDYLSVAPYQAPAPPPQLLFAPEVLIIERPKPSGIEPGSGRTSEGPTDGPGRFRASADRPARSDTRPGGPAIGP